MYSLKTAIGNWIEDAGGSSVYKRGFHSDAFQTECQHQQSGRRLQNDPIFGAGLPQDVLVPRKTTDIFNPSSGPQSSTWQTNTQTMLKTAGGRVLQTSNQQAKQTIAPDVLGQYRKKWTNDTPHSVAMRFQTESRRAGNSGTTKRFEVRSVRYLPGTPIAFERFRDRLLEKYGILGMSCLRYAIGPLEEVSSADFYKLVQSCKVEVSKQEIQQMMAYLTPTDTIDTARLMATVRGLRQDESGVNPATLYDEIVYNNDSQALHVIQCPLLLNSNKYPDLVAGLQMFLPGYANSSDEVTASAFALLCSDMVNADPQLYGIIMKDLWGAL